MAEESRRGPKCEGNLQFLSKAPISNDFTLTISQLVTISPSKFLNPPLYVNFTYPDNNNPMQRICEEKARRILHWAFMKDCQ